MHCRHGAGGHIGSELMIMMMIIMMIIMIMIMMMMRLCTVALVLVFTLDLSS